MVCNGVIETCHITTRRNVVPLGMLPQTLYIVEPVPGGWLQVDVGF